MKGYKILLAWLLTVITGSIGLPLWAALIQSFESNSGVFGMGILDEWLEISFLCMLFSGLLSLPTVIVLIIQSAILRSKKYTLRKQFRKINFTHILMAVITLFVMEAYFILQEMNMSRGNFSMEVTPLLGIAGVIFWYMLCALPCWALWFRKELRSIRSGEAVENSGVIDSL